jgi:energy-coupling factor transporter ATP-binding protein EcfA2
VDTNVFSIFEKFFIKTSMENNVTLISPTQFYITRKDEEANSLIRQLRERKLAAILGESGAGKTTFAKITLPKALQGGKISGAQGSEWRVVYTAPLSDPIENLARGLGTATPNGLFQPGQQEEISRRTDYATLLREHSNPLGVVYPSICCW